VALGSTRPPGAPGSRPLAPTAEGERSASSPPGRSSGRISLQVSLAVVAASTLVFGLSSYLILRAQRGALIAQVDHQAQLVSETVKSSTRYAMLLNRREDVHQIIDTIGRQEEIHQVRIFNKEGQVIYSPDKSLLGEFVDKQTEACYACHAADRPLARLSRPQRTRIFGNFGEGRQLGIINPIYNEPSCWQASCHAHAEEQSVLGILDVTLPLAEVDRRLAATARRAAVLSAAAILAIVVILWLFFRQRVVKPVGQLLEATNRVAGGDLEHRLQVSRNDELGLLQHSFNDMIRRLATAQSQIYQSDRLASIGRLAAGVAHEINNPLTGVLGHSSFLHKRAPAGSEEKKDLETIVHETKRCREIVRQLLDFARQAPMSKTSVEINPVIERALRIVDNQLKVKNVRTTLALRDGLPAIQADANQLAQVLINLLVNAADAIGPGGGEIYVGSELEEDEAGAAIEIKVADDGGGIAEEDLGRIFEPFFTTKGAKGTGLGLAVAWGIVQEHGGSIAVDSSVGRGTTFTLRLPLQTPAAVVGEEGGPSRA
jgi:two-component system NtrC family sensor kinase